MRRSLLALLAWSSLVGAQQAQPGPELKKLAYFIGTWRGQGEMRASMFGPAGTVSNTTRNEWTLNKFFYISHHEEQNTSGTFEVLSITGYDPEKKVYVSYSFDMQGGVGRRVGTLTHGQPAVAAPDGARPDAGHDTARGAAPPAGGDETWTPGDRWTWTSEYVVGGRTIKSRGVDTPTSATSYRFIWQIAPNGNDWQTVQSGTATRVQ